MYQADNEEYYLDRLTFLAASTLGAMLPIDVAVEYTGGEKGVRVWAWDGSAMVSRFEKDGMHVQAEEGETISFDTFLQRYMDAYMTQQRCNDARYREKLVNGRYVPSPDLHGYYDSDSE